MISLAASAGQHTGDSAVIQDLVRLLIVIAIICLCCGSVSWLIRQAGFIPEPPKSIIIWIVMAIGVLIVIGVALPIAGVSI
jgi:hypothetical protein